jgi:serine phosphatase RsbU (regulator of sigma subunit)
MGKGMAAAMLMATVRASLRAVGHNRPSLALELAESAVLGDLENSESFVTLFHAQLYAAERSLLFVDCGHGYAFVRRANGEVMSLTPRGLPLGVPGKMGYEEGSLRFAPGDTLVLYSDGLIDARPELALNQQFLANQLQGTARAGEMLERLIRLAGGEGPLPDDMTVLVVHCNGETRTAG